MQRRRGLSQILGSLMVLAIVASIGSVILFQGLDQITAFNYDLSVFDRVNNEKLKEDLLFQHVRFVNSTALNEQNIELYVANIGSVESTITSVTIVHNDSQELVLAWEEPENDVATIQVDDNQVLNMTASLDCPASCIEPKWEDDYYEMSEYQISITTSRGNFFSTVAIPWNT